MNKYQIYQKYPYKKQKSTQKHYSFLVPKQTQVLFFGCFQNLAMQTQKKIKERLSVKWTVEGKQKSTRRKKGV